MDLSYRPAYEEFRDQAPRGGTLRSKAAINWQKLLIDNDYTARTFPKEVGGYAAQQEQFIRPILHGEMVWCQGYSEPGAGSDLANLRPCAVLEVRGGMGFTDLVGLHYWFKRIGSNRQSPGSPERLRLEAAQLQELV